MSDKCTTPDIVLKPGGSLYEQIAPDCASDNNLVLKRNESTNGVIPASSCIPSDVVVLEDNNATSGILVINNCDGMEDYIVRPPWNVDIDFALLKEDGSYLVTIGGDYLLAYES